MTTCTLILDTYADADASVTFVADCNIVDGRTLFKSISLLTAVCPRWVARFDIICQNFSTASNAKDRFRNIHRKQTISYVHATCSNFLRNDNDMATICVLKMPLNPDKTTSLGVLHILRSTAVLCMSVIDYMLLSCMVQFIARLVLMCK